MNAAVHALIGGMIGLKLSTGDPELFFIAGFLGGSLPDIDSVFGVHRKTFHFPWMFTGLGASLFLLGAHNSPIMLSGIFFLSAGAHSLMDVLAGGELRTWRKDEWSDEAVYDHIRGKWFRPRRILHGPSVRELGVGILVGALILMEIDALWIQVLVGISLFGVFTYLVIVKYLELVPDDYLEMNLLIKDKKAEILEKVLRR